MLIILYEKMAKLILWKHLLLLFIVHYINADRIRDMIYEPLDGVAACFRRHNGTHQFGCSSSRSGSVGVIHLLENENNIVWLEKNATAGPYTVVLPFSMFTKDILIRLRNTDNISGILLTRNMSESRPNYYSPDDTCPNRYSGLKECDTSKPWNSHGYSLLQENWPFPMFYIENETIIESVKECFWKYNAHNLDTQSKRSLCALEMKSFMFAAVNSESCIRRSNSKIDLNPTLFCDPLGDKNIFWPIAPLDSDSTPVIFITARLDAASLFDGLAPGAGSTATGIVTLLATAEYLNSLSPLVEKANVVFLLLNGEAFDYIGSSRLVYDLKEGNLGNINLSFNQIVSIIELGQLSVGQLYLHTMNDEGNDIVKQLQLSLSANVLKNSIPPASIQSFLKEKSNLSTIVISDHTDQFKNQYYNGILDDAENLDFERNNKSLAASLSKIAVELANALYVKVTGNKPPVGNKTATLELVNGMLTCYISTAKCDLFRAASPPGVKFSDEPLPLYVGVHRVINPITSLTGQLLALFTGEKLTDMSETMCHEKNLPWMSGLNFTGVCVNTTVKYSTAVSPAFIIEGYDMKSGEFSTWTESIWQNLNVRMFLKPSTSTEHLSFILGTTVAIASFIVVYFINSKASILFNTREAVEC